jgi:hypothetical protein
MKTTAGKEADHRFLTQIKKRILIYLLLPLGMFEHIQMVTGLYGSSREQHANTQTIQNTYLSFKKYKLNPCLKREKYCL